MPPAAGDPSDERPTGDLRFLVTGTARSGTTLVQRLRLRTPRGVGSPGDPLLATGGHSGGRVRLAADVATIALRQPRGLLELTGDAELPVDARAITKQMTSRHRRIGLWTLFESLVAALSPPDRTILGEKTPNHMFWWEQMKLAVPELKLIAVVRDPADVLRSHRGVSWGEHDVHAFAERWIAHQRIVARRSTAPTGPSRCSCSGTRTSWPTIGRVTSRIAGFLGVGDAPSKLKRSLLAEYPLFPAARKVEGEGTARPFPQSGLGGTGESRRMPTGRSSRMRAGA